MDEKALWKISYGMYMVSSRKNDKINGQIANTVFQVSNSPPTIAVSINKQNLTGEYIHDSRYFAISVLSQDTPLNVIGHFGFKSGREIEKFSNIAYNLTPQGLPYLKENTLAWLEAKVIQEVDAGTHTIFIAEVTSAEVMGEGTCLTYEYYQQTKRGSVPKTAPTYSIAKEEKKKMKKYVCSVCGYVYDPDKGDPENGIKPGTSFDELPADWKCPVCGAGKDAFELEG